jgi:hypothetical protein
VIGHGQRAMRTEFEVTRRAVQKQGLDHLGVGGLGVDALVVESEGFAIALALKVVVTVVFETPSNL